MSRKRREDTKKERKLEFTCSERDKKTRRNRASWNLRVRKETRRHEEREKAGIYVSEESLGDTKKEEKQEFTCLGRNQKTRRKKESWNLRVWEEVLRHEEREEAGIYVSEKRS